MRKILTEKFFNRPALTVAHGLLGKYLVRKIPPLQNASKGKRGREIAFCITEVEAYDGAHDLASHARYGLTPRTSIMFGPPGRFYVYFTYGMHWLMNVVVRSEGYPAAVLLRAGVARDPKTGKKIFVNGPARLTKFLKIDKRQDGAVAARKSGIWIEDRGAKIKKKDIVAGKRIGVAYAGPVWANKRWNFKLKRLPEPYRDGE